MNKDKYKTLPSEITDAVQPILIHGEEILGTFHESFNWDAVRTWVAVTHFRLIILKSLPWSIEVEDFHLRDMNIQLKRDNLGPYDIMEFKSKEKELFEIAVFRNRRVEAQEFLHEVSKHIRQQDIYGHLPIDSETENATKDETTHDHTNILPERTNIASRIKYLETNRVIAWCSKYLNNLRAMGAITEEEYQDEKKNNPECK